MVARRSAPGAAATSATSSTGTQRRAIAQPGGKSRAAVPQTATSAIAQAEPIEPARTKLVRDSFTMPKTEYSVLAELKLRAARLGRPIKKGELLRAGVAALRSLPDRLFLGALDLVPTLKPGRPKGSRSAHEAQRPRGKKHRKS